MLDVNSDDFQASLKKHISGIEDKILDEVMKAALEIRNVAASNSPVKTGNLRASWQVRKRREIKGGEVQVLNNAKYWRAVEYGTKPHIIQAKTKKVLANKKEGKVFGKTVNHPGTKPKPMIRPALKKVLPLFIERLKRL